MRPKKRGPARGGWLPPGPEELGRLFGDLLSREVSVSKSLYRPLDPPCVVGGFATGDGVLQAACVMDLALAANLGAALTMMPLGVAEDSVRARRLEDLLEENVREVLNIGSRWFMGKESLPHVTLDRMYQRDFPAPLSSLLKQPSRKQGYAVEVRGYKGGQLGLVYR